MGKICPQVERDSDRYGQMMLEVPFKEHLQDGCRSSSVGRGLAGTGTLYPGTAGRRQHRLGAECDMAAGTMEQKALLRWLFCRLLSEAVSECTEPSCI